MPSPITAAPRLFVVSRACGLALYLPTLATPVSAAAADQGSARLVESPLSSANLIETAVGLAAVLALVLGLAWLVRRFVQVPGAGRGQIQVLGGVALGPREKAVLISVQGRRLLLGVAPGQVRTLLEFEGAGADGDTQGPPFSEQLDAARRPGSAVATAADGDSR